jgi:hypothetical protein
MPFKDPKKKLEWRRKYRAAHLEQRRDHRRETCCRQKQKAVARYGGRCACCGETAANALTIDHIKGGGTKHVKSLQEKGTTFYTWLLRQPHRPEEFRVLCWTCNAELGLFGFCHHHPEIRQIRTGFTAAAEVLPLFDQQKEAAM